MDTILELKKQIENSSKSKSHLRVVRNLENGVEFYFEIDTLEK